MRAFFKHLFIAIGASTAMLAAGSVAYAMNASPHTIEEVQPDGTRIQLRVRGDEHYHWLEDLEGYTVLRDPASREYRYARRIPDGRLAPGTLRVGRDNPRSTGIARRIQPAPERIRQRDFENRTSPISRRGILTGGGPQAADGDEAGGAPSLPEAVPAAGSVENLVLLIRFSDHAARTLPPNGDFGTLFNAVGGHATIAPSGSVRDVYFENSYGQMTLVSTVNGWIDLPDTETYYANNDSGLTTRTWQAITSALDSADSTVDFGDFDTDNDGWIDSIAFIHSGYGAEWGGTDVDGTASVDRMWSHRWSIPTWTSSDTNDNGVNVKVSDYHISPGLWGTSGSNIGHIGVISHETGHFFGLPDLYDTTGTGSGIGSYGMMANSWGFDGSQLYPPHFSPWSKIDLGWLTPTVISTPGSYDLARVQDNPAVFRIDSGYPSGEYLLIENRQAYGFDAQMPQGGLAIYHIDDTTGYNTEGYPGQPGWPQNGNHYRVALLQADGDYDLERQNNRGDGGDVYHGGGVDRIGPDTVPNTDAYQDGNIVVNDNEISAISTSGASMQFTFGLAELPPNITSTPRLTAIQGQPYLYDCDGTIEATGSTPITFSLTSTGPTGFSVTSAGVVSWTPATTGTFPVQITASNGIPTADTQNFSINVVLPTLPGSFSDDFETDSCWTPDPDGTDSATTGHWERANPQSTSDGGNPAQPGNTHSGSFGLITGGDAGVTAGVNDIDGGITSIRSPSIPISANFTSVQLDFWYYFFNAANSSSADFLRVTLEGTSTSLTVLDLQGTGSLDLAEWTQQTVDISGFIGDTVTILVEAADSANPSLVEAAIDDVSITGTDTTPENTAPNVEAGGPHSLNFPTVTQVNLNGTVIDDGQPVPPNVTTRWTVTGGVSDNVIFGNGSLIDTTATFSASGVYTLTLSADDGELQNSDEVVVIVNMAPSVDAGERQIITLPTPNFVNLDGTVSDDGLPTPPNVTTRWTVISGNGADVTIGDDTLQDTTATFSTDGTYVFRITADDGLFTPLPFDNVAIVVFPPPTVNQPPVVNINTGSQTITMPAVNSVSIDGTVTDDGLPNPPAATTITWSVSSGDATRVNFNPGNAEDTIATFSATGVYTLRLTADDGGVGDPPFAEITITVDGLSKEDTAAVLVPILYLLDD